MPYCPNCNAAVDDGALLCSACGADFGPESAWHPGSSVDRASHSLTYVVGKSMLYLGYGLLTLAWLVSCVGSRKSGLAVLIGFSASLILIPVVVLGHVLVAYSHKTTGDPTAS